MKVFTILISSIFLFTLLSTQAAKPLKGTEGKGAGSNRMINAKCHVALIDGSEAILFWRTKLEHLPKLSSRIVGLNAARQKSIEKIKVYNAFECVAEGKQFASLKAKTLDKKTPR